MDTLKPQMKEQPKPIPMTHQEREAELKEIRDTTEPRNRHERRKAVSRIDKLVRAEMKKRERVRRQIDENIQQTTMGWKPVQ